MFKDPEGTGVIFTLPVKPWCMTYPDEGPAVDIMTLEGITGIP